MKHSIFIFVLGCLQIVNAQNSNQNYIQTRTMTNESATNYIEQIQYYDGLGRPVQTVQKGITPNHNDLVNYQEYDPFGRESNAWLPRIAQGNNGAFVPFGTFTGLSTDIYQNDAKTYSKLVYENSPLNRVTEQYAPGADWHNKNKSVKTDYLSQRITLGLLCSNYSVSGSGINTSLKYNIRYAANQLFVTQTTDEDGRISYEFKDKLGRIVLTRQKIDGIHDLDTYYVYDDSGNLCYVLTPACWNIVSSLDDDMEVLKRYAYIYKYDHRNRCIKKRLPGCDWIEYVYDQADRLIFSQNGEQRINNQWQFSIPDDFGRVALTGILHNTDFSISDEINIGLQSFLPSTNIVECVKAGMLNMCAKYTETGPYRGYRIIDDNDYLNRESPVDEIIEISFENNPLLLSVNYYDRYTFMGKNSIPNISFDTSAGADFNKQYTGGYKGLLTGTLSALMEGDSVPSYLYSVMYYDIRGRVIQTHSNSHLPGGMEKEYIAYNFTGQPTQRKHIHSATGKTTQTEVYTYTYDHAGRLAATTHQLNGGATVTLAQNTYDELGRLATSTPNNQQSLKLTYDYNVRSWVTGITGQLFSEKLYYNQPFAGGVPCYNGNISTAIWDDYMGFNYSYDNASRLTRAENFLTWNNMTEWYYGVYAYTSAYGYDRNGNMTYLYWVEDLLTTCISIQRRGNQLSHISDWATLYPSEHPDGAYSAFMDVSHNPNARYAYDANGSMTLDPYKGVEFSYNTLGMPKQTRVPAVLGTIDYKYSATGRKLETAYKWHSGLSLDPLENTNRPQYQQPNSSLVRQYVGNKEYENGALKRIHFDNGFYANGNYHFYLRDHLGNNNLVVRANGQIMQRTYYHPYGKPIGNGESFAENFQPYKFGGKEEENMLGVNLYDFEARQLDKVVPEFTTMDPLCERYYSVSPYAYCSNNPINRVDPDGMDDYLLIEDGRTILAKKTDNKYDQLYATTKDKDGNISKLGDPLRVNDQSLLPQLAGGKNSAIAETSNSSDAFGVFKFAADNSSPEWSLKGYKTEGGKGFLLSTSYDPDQVTSGNGSYDPAKLIFALHSHPDGTDNIGPSGSITKIPLTTDKYDISGDIMSMYNRQIKSPTARHYIYHEGTKKLIYYDWYTVIDKKTQNDRGRSNGIVNSGSQMRKKILGY